MIVICQYNPWFPSDRTLEEAIWERTCHKVEKAYRQGEKILVEFWVPWALVKTVILILGGEGKEEDLQAETAASQHT